MKPTVYPISLIEANGVHRILRAKGLWNDEFNWATYGDEYDKHKRRKVIKFLENLQDEELMEELVCLHKGVYDCLPNPSERVTKYYKLRWKL